MKSKYVVVALALITVLCVGSRSTVSACLNEYYYQGGEKGPLLGHPDSISKALVFATYPPRSRWERDSALFAGRVQARSNYRDLTDYSTALVHLGHYKQALELLRRVEGEAPGQYVTASNMGTVYELLGNNDSALVWIREGMLRKPESHSGSEWLHVKILEAKIQLQRDPSWLATHSFLDLEFGTGDSPHVTDAEIKRVDMLGPYLNDREKAFEYQLYERMEFVRPPDPVVSRLLFDLANIIAYSKDVAGESVAIYRKSEEYGGFGSPLLSRRMEKMEAIAPIVFLSSRPGLTLALAIGTCIVLIAAAIAVLHGIRSQKKLRSGELRKS